MSQTESKPHFGDETADALYDEGFETIAQFVDGPVRINELEPADLLEPLENGWVLRAFNDDEEIQYARGLEGHLIQIRDGGRDGEFGRPFEAWVEEFGDYVFSGQYALEYITAYESAFEG